MDNFKVALSAVGVSGTGVAFLYFLTKDLVKKADNLSPELIFVLLGLAFFLIFILTFKMLSKPRVSRDSSVSVDGYNSGTIDTGDKNISKKEDNRDSHVSVGGNNAGNIITGDNNTID